MYSKLDCHHVSLMDERRCCKLLHFHVVYGVFVKRISLSSVPFVLLGRKKCYVNRYVLIVRL